MNTSKKHDAYRVIFVVGCQRTGTTLIGNILGAHSRAVLIDEADQLYPWVEAVLEGRDDTASFLECCRLASRNYLEPSTRISSEGQLRPAISHLVLKAPNLTYVPQKLTLRFSDPVFVFAYRDIRDVVVSMSQLDWIPMVERQLKRIQSHPEIRARFHSEIRSLTDPHTPCHIQRALIATIKTSLMDTFDRANMRTIKICYEDLVTQPQTTIDRLLKHCGLQDDSRCFNHEQTMAGWGPGLTFRRRGIDSVSSGRWSLSLSEEQAQQIWEVSSHCMEMLGYEKTHSPKSAPEWWPSTSQRPVILSGLSGSGASTIGKILATKNIFMGNHLDQDHSSLEWVEIIHKIAVERIRSQRDEVLHHWIRPLRKAAERVLANGSWDGTQRWGFHVPLAMLAFPELDRAFPECLVIHLTANPVLLATDPHPPLSPANAVLENQILQALRKDPAWRQAMTEATKPMKIAALWYYEVNHVLHMDTILGDRDRFMAIRQEDLQGNPMTCIQNLCSFLDICDEAAPIDHHTLPPGQPYDESTHTLALEIWNLCGNLAEKLGHERRDQVDRDTECQGPGPGRRS